VAGRDVAGGLIPRVFQIAPDTGHVLQEYSLPMPAGAAIEDYLATGMQGLHDRLVVLTHGTDPIAVGA